MCVYTVVNIWLQNKWVSKIHKGIHVRTNGIMSKRIQTRSGLYLDNEMIPVCIK